tara:strand:+ start:765 stop:1364 length:600 start_codon:yes stop_codon:yes gene_type:complete
MQSKKIKEILIGSNNNGKIKEIKDLLPKKLKIYTPKEYKIKSPKETGNTFKKNSYLKAKYFSKKTGKICLADDSGLEIYILDKLPGIYSARWAGKKKNFNMAINKVYKQLKKKKLKNNKVKARFVCALTIYWPNGKFISSIGKINGNISKNKIGKKGFGYDPIFIPEGKKLTFGQMKPSLKYKIDHRFKAFKKLKNFLN